MDTQTPMNDHDLLIEVSTTVKNMNTTLAAYNTNTSNSINDHETRVRLLEADNQQIKGAQKNQRMWLAVLGAVVGIGGLVLGIIQFIRG